MDRWTEIELFVQVAELGSLSRAAEALGLSNAAASRHLAALEARLDARLVQRNTRRLFLTDVGDAFYRRCKPSYTRPRPQSTRRCSSPPGCCASRPRCRSR
jgi:DNA-binding transcriptional LysR family regulator